MQPIIKKGDPLNRNELADAFLILLMSGCICIIISFMQIEFAHIHYLLCLLLIIAAFLVLRKVTGLYLLRSKPKLTDLGLFSSLLLVIVLGVTLFSNALIVIFGTILFITCLIRLFYMCKGPNHIANEEEFSLVDLLNSEQYNGESIDDCPVKSDLFGIDNFIESLANRINVTNSSFNNVIGLIGPWGSGKTTDVLLAYNKYLKDDYDLVQFDAWSDIKSEMPIIDLLDAIMDKLPGFTQYPHFRRRLVNDLIGSGNAWVSVSGSILDSISNDESKQLRLELNDYLVASKRHILIVIDNLDRAPSRHIRVLVSALNGLFRIQNTTFVLMYDEVNLKKVFKKNDYLEKLVIHPIHVPLFSSNQYYQILVSSTAKIAKDNDYVKELSSTLWAISFLIKTPREMIMVINMIRQLKFSPITFINPEDFLVLRFMEVFNPGLYRSLIDSGKYVCTKYNYPSEPDYLKNRESYLRGIKKSYGDYWDLTCILLQITDFGSIVTNNTIRPYSFIDARYNGFYSGWRHSGFEVTDGLFDSWAFNNYQDTESIIDKVCSDVNNYDRSQFLRRISESVSNIPGKERSNLATLLFKKVYLLEPTGFLDVGYICEMLLLNLPKDAHESFLSSISGEYDKVLKLSQIYHSMVRENQNTEEIRNLYRHAWDKMRSDILNQNIDLYHENYHKYNIHGLVHNDNKQLIHKYLKRTVIDNLSRIRFLSDLLVESVRVTMNEKSHSLVVSEEAIKDLTSLDFVRDVFNKIDEGNLDSQEMYEYSVFEDYLLKHDSSQQ